MAPATTEPPFFECIIEVGFFQESDVRKIIVCRFWSCGRWRYEGSTTWSSDRFDPTAKLKIKYEKCDKHEEKRHGNERATG